MDKAIKDYTYEELTALMAREALDGLLTGGGKELQGRMAHMIMLTCQWHEGKQDAKRMTDEALGAAVATRLAENPKDFAIRCLAALQFHAAHTKNEALLAVLKNALDKV